MIHFINGRGQLGEAMKYCISDNEFYSEIKKKLTDDIFIYHTWIVEDKSERTQKNEYEKFKIYVKNNSEKHILFTSTYSEKENWYNYYKQLAESFLIYHCKKCLVIRIPTIIGNGICKKLKNNEVNVFGELNLISVDNAARKILELSTYDGLIKCKTIPGEKVKAATISSLYKI